ncbi:cyclic beta-1,2-glucan synthetase [Polaromonas sp. OV174]|uniref:GH36-type glycosyl hydrolase domain-containing protein n=1 Tax=Polaromonas sp. OV174 TaxID=1855300 RepID=UPI0008E92D32|nr:glucoamylase family protein [Polaromonas sp. OV174]SFC25107.1 cyclic beta-1,2-glucan synthetase [Polaromonas sp. OV174]
MSASAIHRLEAISPYAKKLLLSRQGAIQAPIRAELFGAQRFEQHGRSLAKAQAIRPADGTNPGPPFFPRVQENIRALRQAYDYIALTSRSGHYVTPAAEWLLDNFHLIEAQLQQIQEGVPHRYYADLPKLADKPLAGLPRVYGIAWAYVAHTDSVLDPVLFTAFLHAYQEVSELSLGELWALPTTLRVVLLENLRRMADRIAWNKVAREVAHAAWDSADVLSLQDLDALYADMQSCGLERSYLTQLWQRMPAESVEPVLPLVLWTEQHCQDGLSLLGEGQTTQAEANLTVSNIITTLRLIGQLEWSELIEPVSHSLQILRRLPSFSRESEMTRQQITRAMERLAQQSGKSERTVAQAVLAAALPGLSKAAQTAGYYLMGAGRPLLEVALRPADRPALSRPPARNWRTWRLPIYAAVWIAGTVAALYWAVYPLAALQGVAWVAVFLMAWPASEAAAALIHRLVAESTRIQPLARLDFTAGIPAEHRVLVVIPCMLGSAASNSELAHRLCLHWLASRETHAQFALLTDWVDADTETLATDQALLDDIRLKVQALNHSYPAPAGAAARFLLLHRPRTWSATEGRWIGWERKRGKLEMLLRQLAESSASVFAPQGPGMHLATDIRYVLTLDSDTGLPAGSLRELVSIAAHPLNTPHIDFDRRRVTAGYGILQPRVVTPLSAHHERSPYHAMFAGQCGLDPYSSGVSDLYQDLFGMGNFTGKGLLHVAAVHAVLDRRIPEGAILSHDLLEGSIARCGYVGDVVLLEDHPHHAGVAASRVHRWTRGDWQLLPLMLHARRYGIDALGLWRMADNLRRSLLAPACLLLLAWVVATGALPLATALAFVLAALLVGPLLGALAGLVPTRRGIAWLHFFDVGVRDVLRGLAATAWQFSQLFIQAGLMLDAMARALWRMLLSRRKLLEWTTAAQAQASAKYCLGAFMRKYAVSSLLCLLLALAAWWSPHPWAGPALFMLWALAPLPAWWASRPAANAPLLALDTGDRDYLEQLARQTWQFFEHCVGPEDNHLPPDNLQMEPEPTIAHRTSPTNIGLYLLAVACARRFEWISTAELIARLQATLDTVERLPKHQGHLLNWYDTRTLQGLAPDYVSTVDSGNLAGHLLATAQACRELLAPTLVTACTTLPPEGVDFPRGGPTENSAPTLVAPLTAEQAARLQEIANRCDRLCMAMDFSSLYNAKRNLFHIGLRVHEQVLDDSYYDLISSEARLTSYLAIAKGDVPRRHWQALGRVFLTVGITPGLKSWSGSMFEYLMPSLVMAEPDQGLLHVSGLAAVMEQQAYGRAQQLPWGVSESAYFGQDHTLAYQYSPFGVPRLALRRTPPGDRVVAPYASVMASMFMPHEAVANLRRLEGLGARGEYGFVDAVDFTASRQPGAQALSLVNTFMAHHQGMSLVALCNVLCKEAPRRWFSSAPVIQAHDALLHEKTPRQIVESADPRTLPEPEGIGETALYHAREVDPAASGWQPTQLLSNGNYSVALRANGAGVSRWRAKNITRWRDDLLRDAYGTFIYLRTTGEERVASLTFHPAPHPDWIYKATFLADRVQFEAKSEYLEATTTVLVSPEDDTEIRTVMLHNLSNSDISIEVISCFEAVLADQRADEAHPAFSNLFLDTQWHAEWRALLLSRKPRLQGDPVMAVAHFLADAEADVRAIDFIADRRSFLGRNRMTGQPALQAQARREDGTPLNGLDPVASLRVRVRIAAGGVARLSFATAAAEQADELISRVDKYLQPMHVERAARMAVTLAQVRLRDLDLAPERHAALQDLNTALMYTATRPLTERGPLDQRQLWRFGLSGDKPIVLVRIHASNGMALVHALLRALPLWSFGGLAVDVVIINSEINSYLMPLHQGILALRDRTRQQTENSFPNSDAGGFFLLRDHELTASEKAVLAGLARFIFIADGRPLEQQVATLQGASGLRRRAVPASPPIAKAAVADPLLDPVEAERSPLGRFDAASGEFQFQLDSLHRPPRPWVNVIANPSLGFQVSEAGAGYTWAINSRLHQLTPWSNDPVQDPAFEHYLLQDLDSQKLLALTPSTESGSQLPYQVRHGQGYTVFACQHGDLQLETTFFADRSDAVKIVQVKLHNQGSEQRHLRALAMVEWQMGAARQERRTVHGWKVPNQPTVFAQQRESRAGFGGSSAFLSLVGLSDPMQWTCDRSEFFDVAGRLVLPEILGQQAGTAADPCAALSGAFALEPGQSLELAFMLGHATDAAQAQQLARDWQGKDLAQALKGGKQYWNDLLGKVQVRTPDPLFDALLNRWLLYQTLSSRLWSKAGFYQAGGAFGFRDQLQDAMAFALIEPGRLRQQILLNASRQFPEGDVQHWWHAPGGEGVRTHFSDDLLWLPFACAHYIDVTGDTGILDEDVAFIDGPPIPDGAEDAYYAPQLSAQTASIFTHCARAIDRSLATGSHGLPLMGTGDWNDGMNRVGHEGKGESVWLAWFLCAVVQAFAPLAQACGDSARAQKWRDAREGWINALHSHGWDGAWFRRAFFDNGAPLGSSQNDECRIDLIAQAWAVLSGASSEAFTKPAMQAMNEQLVDREAGLLRLLTPPLATSANNPGYIQAYPPGVRENGGQYAHAGVWAMMAQAQTGDTEAAWESFQMLSPAHRSQHPTRGPTYELEPYVMAGDVYGAPPYVGRGGWSWYTGSAAWLHRAALETLLGLYVRQGKMSLTPRVPAHWPSFEITLRLKQRVVILRWQRAGLPAEDGFKPDRVVAPGQVLLLAELPAQAHLLVQAEP